MKAHATDGDPTMISWTTKTTHRPEAATETLDEAMAAYHADERERYSTRRPTKIPLYSE